MSPAPSETLIAPDQRVPVPAFEALAGFVPGEGLAPEDLVGHVSVVNAWFEW